MRYFAIQLKTIKGSYYLCKCTAEEYDALVACTQGLEQAISIKADSFTATTLWCKIEATESLRTQEYMFITYGELVELLKEVFNVEVYYG